MTVVLSRHQRIGKLVDWLKLKLFIVRLYTHMFLDLLPGHSGFQRRHRRPHRVDQARTAARRQVRAGRLLRPEDGQPHLDHAKVRRRPRQGEIIRSRS